MAKHLDWERLKAREQGMAQEAPLRMADVPYRMRSKFSGQCARCGGPIAAGEWILWHRDAGAAHAACGSKQPAPPPQAGPSPALRRTAKQLGMSARGLAVRRAFEKYRNKQG